MSAPRIVKVTDETQGGKTVLLPIQLCSVCGGSPRVAPPGLVTASDYVCKGCKKRTMN